MKTFKIYTDRQFRVLLRLLKEYAILHDTETLHKIRVDIKKIKAVLKALEYQSRKKFNAHRHYLPLRNIFRKANHIREPELMVKLLLEYRIEGIKDDQLLGEREPLIASFREEIPFFLDKVRRAEHLLEKPVLAMRVPAFRNYLRRKAEKIRKKLDPRPDFRTIHDTRKKIKHLIYLSAIDQGMRRKNYRFYRTVEQLIGQLHDKQVLMEFLRKHINSIDTIALSTLKQECLRDKKEIAALAKKFYG